MNVYRRLAKIFIKDYQDTANVVVRARYGTLEAWSGILINLLLFAVKLVMGIMVSSVALIADAVHTLSDAGTSIVILVGFRVAKKPGDREHPFGHGQAEHIAGLIVAVTLIVAGIEVLKSSTLRIFDPVVSDQISWIIIAILCVTIAIKEFTARFARDLGRMIDSPTLEADFWHHRSDAISTVLVVAAIIGGRYGMPYLDGVGGVAVAGVIIYSGYRIAQNAIDPLMGQSPSRQLVLEIENIACSVNGVDAVHDVIIHHYGQLKLTSLHIEVKDSMSINVVHDISEKVEELIEQQYPGSAVVHIDPINRDHPRYQEIHNILSEIIADCDSVAGFHDLRLVGEKKLKAIFDVNIKSDVDDDYIPMIMYEIRKEMKIKIPDVELVIKAEPQYTYND